MRKEIQFLRETPVRWKARGCALFTQHWKKKWSHFDLKSWVTGGTKIRPGIPSNWKLFESNWLDIESQIDNLNLNNGSIWLSISGQFDSQYRVNLTLNIGSIWLSISSQFDSQYRVNLTLNIESIWLSISSQFDSQYRVNLTLNIESIWLLISIQFDSNIFKLLGIPGRILVPLVTQLFRSKWLHFFFQSTSLFSLRKLVKGQ